MTKKTPETDRSQNVLFRAKRGKGKLSVADARLWEKVTESIEPLDEGIRRNLVMAMPEPVGPTAAPPPKAKPKAKATRPSPQPVAPPPGPPAHRPDQTELNHGATPGIDKRTANRFKKGRMAIQGRLDLHGHSQRDAHVALRRFISDAYAAEKRCVLVVTGKGRRNFEGGGFDREGAVGVLRQSVPRWLNEPGLRAKVLSFSHAAPSDGGEGALYILLKRRRGD